jgi:hypothetical protein
MTSNPQRTTFPSAGNFEGYWVTGKTRRTLAQLVHAGRNIYTDNTYNLLFTNGQVGDGTWTTEELLEKEARITYDKPTQDAP